MTINTYLEGLSSKLVLSVNEKNTIETSIGVLEWHLNSHFDNVTESFVFGSYTRRTILPRFADEQSDIDYMIVFSDGEQRTPQTCLNRLKDFTKRCYHTSEIYQSSPTIVLELNHIKFELVPAYSYYGSYYIPDSYGNWMYTSPNDFNRQLTESNNNNNYKIKTTVRLIKYWNISKNQRDLSSFEMERRIADFIHFRNYECANYIDYAIKVLQDFYSHFYSYGYTILSGANRVRNAINSIQDAIWYEGHNQPNSALQSIKKVFPEF